MGDPTRSATADRRHHGLAAPGPVGFRAALGEVAAIDRDAWLDGWLGLDAIPDDGPALPAGGVPYLPCPVDALLEVVDCAGVTADDVLVDVGAGVGRAAAAMHLLTGATAIAIEIQPALAGAARQLAARLGGTRLSVIEGDAANLAALAGAGSVFFLYCPFGGRRLDKVLLDLESIAQRREIRICTVDLPLPPRRWLTRIDSSVRCEVYRSSQAGEAPGGGPPVLSSTPHHRGVS